MILIELIFNGLIALLIILVALWAYGAWQRSNRIPGHWYAGGDLTRPGGYPQGWIYRYDPDNPDCDKLPVPPSDDDNE